MLLCCLALFFELELGNISIIVPLKISNKNNVKDGNLRLRGIHLSSWCCCSFMSCCSICCSSIFALRALRNSRFTLNSFCSPIGAILNLSNISYLITAAHLTKYQWASTYNFLTIATWGWVPCNLGLSELPLLISDIRWKLNFMACFATVGCCKCNQPFDVCACKIRRLSFSYWCSLQSLWNDFLSLLCKISWISEFLQWSMSIQIWVSYVGDI